MPADRTPTDWTPGRHSSAALQVSLLGLTEMAAALQLQDRISRELATRSDTYGELLLCEHPTGVTIGRDGSVAELQTDRHVLVNRGIPVDWVRRGGGAWAHHAGQLVAYLLVPQARLGIDAPGVQKRLTASLLAVAKELGVPAQNVDTVVGARGRCGQFGFVGAGLREGIVQFGGCLNVSVPRGALQLVRWGDDVRASCLSSERMRPMAMATARECWVRHLAAAFGYEEYRLNTGHPWLQRVLRCHPTLAEI